MTSTGSIAPRAIDQEAEGEGEGERVVVGIAVITGNTGNIRNIVIADEHIMAADNETMNMKDTMNMMASMTLMKMMNTMVTVDMMAVMGMTTMNRMTIPRPSSMDVHGEDMTNMSTLNRKDMNISMNRHRRRSGNITPHRPRKTDSDGTGRLDAMDRDEVVIIGIRIENMKERNMRRVERDGFHGNILRENGRVNVQSRSEDRGERVGDGTEIVAEGVTGRVIIRSSMRIARLFWMKCGN